MPEPVGFLSLRLLSNLHNLASILEDRDNGRLGWRTLLGSVVHNSVGQCSEVYRKALGDA